MRKWSRVILRKYSFLFLSSLKISKRHTDMMRVSERNAWAPQNNWHSREKAHFAKMQCNPAQSAFGQRSEKRHDVTAVCRRLEGSSDEHTLHDLMIKPTSGYHRAWCSVFQVSCDDKALHFTSAETPLAFNSLQLLLLLQQVSCTSATTSNREEGVYILSHIQAERPTGMETASQHSQRLLLLGEMIEKRGSLSLITDWWTTQRKGNFLLVRNLFENCISVGPISHDVLVKAIFSTLHILCMSLCECCVLSVHMRHSDLTDVCSAQYLCASSAPSCPLEWWPRRRFLCFGSLRDCHYSPRSLPQTAPSPRQRCPST